MIQEDLIINKIPVVVNTDPDGDWRNNKTDAVAVGIYEDLKMSRQIQGVNRELGRGISNALSANLLKGKNNADLAPTTNFILPLNIFCQISLLFFFVIFECQIAGLKPK